MPINKITHKGKEIMFCDFKDMKNKQAIFDQLDEMANTFKQTKGNLLVLTDVRGTKNDPEIVDKTKRLGKEVFSVYAKKRAIIGMDGLRGLILKGYNAITGNDLKPFPTLEEAKDYLAAD
ncbi:hypothetical protein [Ekhidna sp.]|uniref:hypothetical protein n=1 Tax=Ekhidna sp. TaxID=2608089 RepID=UPI003CCB94E7